jgi:hypothetical protein
MSRSSLKVNYHRIKTPLWPSNCALRIDQHKNSSAAAKNIAIQSDSKTLDIREIRIYGESGGEILSEMLMPNLGVIKLQRLTEPIVPDNKFINHMFIIISDGKTQNHVLPIIRVCTQHPGFKVHDKVRRTREQAT